MAAGTNFATRISVGYRWIEAIECAVFSIQLEWHALCTTYQVFHEVKMRLHRISLFILVLLTILSVASSSLAMPSELTPRAYMPVVARSIPQPPVSTAEYGVDFISAPDSPADNQRYANGVATGADWNRWPLYWYNVETSAGVFNWSYADSVVTSDRARGLRTEIILMGTPYFYATGGSMLVAEPQVGHRLDNWVEPLSQRSPESPTVTVPTGLYQSVFSDGTDVPGTNKTINSANKWARFVYQAVKHYSSMGITHWEIWNEQDYDFFWSGSPAEYARLLKVAYLAGKHADSDAQIIFGGLANFQQPNFLADVLNVFAGDSLAPSNNWFFDILATHSYSYAWESWYYVFLATNRLNDHNLDKAIWLNESGSPAWNDYPGPVWDPNSGYRSTMAEGAAYVIQSAMYAKFAGADVIFHFQLYDDCGNCPAGSDFWPNNGETCDPNDTCHTCAGDAFGLFRNPTDAGCYTHHPQPETPRPVYNAYRVLTNHLRGVQPLWRQRPSDGSQEWIAFYRPSTQERVIGLWSRDGGTYTAKVPATSSSATLIDRAGNTSTITPSNGVYSIVLQPATNQNLSHAPSIYAIGGPPWILVERDTRAPEVTVSAPAGPTTPSFEVSWSGEDLGSGIQDYDVWVSENGGQFSLWLNDTTTTGATFSGEEGKYYGFVVLGRDQAGNQDPLPAEPEATVQVGTDWAYLPVILRDGKV